VSESTVILVRYGEVMLKGLNRRSFEERLAQNIKRAIRGFGPVTATIAQGRIFVEPIAPPQSHTRAGGQERESAELVGAEREASELEIAEREASGLEAPERACAPAGGDVPAAGIAPVGGGGYDFAGAAKRICGVFGVVSVSVARRTAPEQQAMRECAAEAMRALCPGAGAGGALRFKVETKRGDKRYPMTSPEISRDVGEYLLGHVAGLEVDVANPDAILYIEVRERAYVYTGKIMGFGGLPVGSNGKAMLLLSGGIDSPVAGFMMAKRGVELEAVHFYSYPYTDERAKQKVVRLAEILAGYFCSLKLHVVPFTDIQLAIRDSCREEYLTIIMRRFMMVIADRLAASRGAQALVTGESVGQVASQTIMGLTVTDKAAELPVFRPLIGMDKNEIIEYARRIGTFETSILPYEDCCTVFTPKHPKTKPRLADAEREERRVPGGAALIDAAVAGAELIEARQELL
jgi:thiamine biosynthesis protein ThiI